MENKMQLESLRQQLQVERARAEELAHTLAIEQVYAYKLAQQLRSVTDSRLWRAAQWLRRLAGREPFEPDFNRPPPVLATPEMTERFSEIFVTNAWGSADSCSGRGSDLGQTAVIRKTLPDLLREFGVRTMLDIPCGDFHWMRMLDLDVDYLGADVVSDLIAANNARYGNERRHFQVMDIANDQLPRVDLVFCRDLLVHFSFYDALRAIANLKRSGSTYLLTTTFTNRTSHYDIETGQWRVINLQLPPFNFPPPLKIINERCTERGMDMKGSALKSWVRRLLPRGLVRPAWSDKSLGLWRLVDL